MRFCPRCREPFDPWVDVCLDCQMPLVETLPREPVAFLSYTDLVPIYAAASVFAAELVVARLHASDCPAAVRDPHAAVLFAAGIVCPRGVEVIVPQPFLARARTILGFA